MLKSPFAGGREKKKKMMSAPFVDASAKKYLGATICIGREIQCLPYAGFL